MKIHSSAHRHGVSEADILHAVQFRLVVEDVGDDPERWLVIGPDQAAQLLEIVILVVEEGELLVIHAMKLRTHYQRFLKQ